MAEKKCEFKVVQDIKRPYDDEKLWYYTQDTQDIEKAKSDFGVGTKYLGEYDDKRFWCNAYFSRAWVADNGVIIEIGYPYLD